MIVNRLRNLSLILTATLLLSTHVQAKIYHYVDSDGRKIYVDRFSQIPEQYRDQVEEREEEADRLSDREQRALNNQRTRELNDSKLRAYLSQLEDAKASMITPVTLSSNRVVVPVTMIYGNRREAVRLVLDTGASRTVVHGHIADKLGARLQRGGYAVVADGRAVKIEEINIDRVEVGPYHFKNTVVSVIDYAQPRSKSDGLMGMNFIRSLKYEVDYPNQRIIWDKQRYQEIEDEMTLVRELLDGQKEK